MSQIINEENRRLMRINIIRHRQKVLKFLDGINDTVLRPKIKLNAIDLERIKVKEEPTLIVNAKKELIEDKYNGGNDDVSIGSNDNWDNELTDGTDINSRRRSKRIKTVQHISKNKSKEDYVYNLGDAINNANIQKNRRKRGNYTKSKSAMNPYERFRKPFDRSLHNAKERACRERIAKLFLILSKCCSYLECSRRVPSKHSILIAAKKECKLLVECEKKLIAEKDQWKLANDVLRSKLRIFSRMDEKQDD